MKINDGEIRQCNIVLLDIENVRNILNFIVAEFEKRICFL